MTISKRARFEVLRRDNYTCRYCGASAPHVTLQVDHIVPRALGGSDLPENLTTACEDCNSGKSSIPLNAPSVEEMSQQQEQWRRALAAVAEETAARLDADDKILDDFAEIWRQVTDAEMDEDWRASVHTFMSAGLTVDLIARAIKITLRKNLSEWQQWKYFCGVCWNLIREIEDAAAKVLGDERG